MEYPGYNLSMKLYGPYTRKDGRQHVILIDLAGKRRTVSYPKYLMEQHLGRLLDHDETVDHINNDYTDNRLENLQILSRSDNCKKQFIDRPELRAEYILLVCSYCSKEFFRRKRKHLGQLKKTKNKGYYFCSRSCQGKIFH